MRWLISFLGGYPDVDSALSDIKKDDFPRKNEILTEAVKHLFGTISHDDILRFKDGSYWFEGRPLTREELVELKADAEIFDSKLWRVVQKDVEYQLRKKMFEEASITEDMLWGKLLTFLNDIIKTRIKSLRTLK